MSDSLEAQIMGNIGFCQNPYLLEGNPADIAKQAAFDLPMFIEFYHEKNPKQIDLPDEGLMKLIAEIAESDIDSGNNTLFRTYYAASSIIAAHIKRANATGKDKKDRYLALEVYLQRYLPRGEPERVRLQAGFIV